MEFKNCHQMYNADRPKKQVTMLTLLTRGLIYQKHKNVDFFGVYKWSPCITLPHPSRIGDRAYFGYQDIAAQKEVTMRTLVTRDVSSLILLKT